MKLKVEVTEEDIKEGCRLSPNLCPVARAVSRARNPGKSPLDEGYESAWVTQGVTRFSLESLADRAENPPEVTLFIIRFDTQVPVQPFTFELEIP